MKSSEDVVDLTHDGQTTQHDQGRFEELARIDEKIGALKIRRDLLQTELGIEQSKISTSSKADFLDEGFDAFAGAPTRDAIKNLDVDDEDFDERFAVFAANDEQGDHKARRWFDSA